MRIPGLGTTCSSEKPSPYLVKVLPLVPVSKTALDLGCGAGRNTRSLLNLGFHVVDAYDANPNTKFKPLWLGHDAIPKKDYQYDLVLLNYVLMFLNEKERQQVAREIQHLVYPGAYLVIERYAAKEALPLTMEAALLDYVSLGWEVVRKSKEHALLKFK